MNGSDSKPLLGGFAVIITCAVALEIYSHYCGVMLTPDSYHYLSAAKSFKESGRFINADRSVYVHWPPLYPILLSLFSNPLTVLPWINVFFKICLGLLLCRISVFYFSTNIIRLIFVAVTLCSVHILMISVFVWSELLFLLLILLNFYCTLHLKKSPYYFYLMVITGFLICIQRNAGFFYICAVTAFLLFQDETALSTRLRTSSIFFLVSISGLVSWHIYVSYQPTHYRLTRYPFLEGVAFNASLLFPFLGKILVPFKNWISAALSILSLASIGFVYTKSETQKLLRLPLFSFIFYIAGFLIVERLGVDEIDRFLSICLPFFMLLFLFSAEQFYMRSNAKIRSIIIITLIFWSLYPLSRAVTNAHSWHERSCSAVSGK